MRLRDHFAEFFEAYRKADDEAIAALEAGDLESYKHAVTRSEAALHEIKTLADWKPSHP